MSFSLTYMMNGLSYFAVAVVAFYIFFIWCKKKEPACKIGKTVGINGFFFLIMAFLNLLWAFNVLKPPLGEFILIKSVFMAINAVLILFIVYGIIKDRKLLYLLFLFITSVFGFERSFTNFLLIILGISYLLILLVSLDLVLFSNFYLKKAGLVAVGYSFLSIFFVILIFLGATPSRILWFVPNILLFFFFLFLLFDVRYCGISKEIKTALTRRKKIEQAFVFVRFFIFICSISVFIFFSTIAVHELGHAITAQLYGCHYSKAVVYDITDFPHTEIRCDSYSDFFVTIAGLFLTLAVGLIFFLTGGEFITILSYLIFGFALLISYGDLADLGASENIIAISLFSSIAIIAAAIVKISFYYLEQQKTVYGQKFTGPSEIKPENYFVLKDGTTIKNLYELAHSFEIMEDSTFNYHVNEQKNDFSNWVRDILGDNALAEELLGTKNKYKARELVLKKLIGLGAKNCFMKIKEVQNEL